MNAKATTAAVNDCDNVHDEYYERRSQPRIRLLVLGILASGMSTAAVVLFFIISAKITEHELRDKEVMVTRRDFEQTITRIETRISDMDNNVTYALRDVSDKLDRNLTSIRQSK
jgi:hypothetical protein